MDHFIAWLLHLILSMTSASAKPVNTFDKAKLLGDRAAPAPPSNKNDDCYLLQPTPSGSICGDTGHASPPIYPNPLADNQTVDTIARCRNFCLQRANFDLSEYYYLSSPSCTGFVYDTDSKLCQLYTSPILDFTPNATSTHIFYDTSCFNCPLVCPQKGSKNLVANGGFEDSNTLSGPWIQEYDQNPKPDIVSPGERSKTSVCCPSGENCSLKQYRRLCLGQLFTFSADIKVHSSAQLVNNTGQIYFQYGDMSVLKIIKWSEELSSPSGWQTLFGSFQASDEIYVTGASDGYQSYGYAPSFDISFYLPSNSSNGGVYLDKIQVHPAPSTFATKGKSLLINGGFETGNLSPWTTEYYFRDYPYDQYASENHPGKRNVTTPGLTKDSKYAFLYHGGFLANFKLRQPPISIQKGTRYLLSLAYKANGFVPGLTVTYPNSKAYQSFLQEIPPTPIQGLISFQRAFTALEDSAQIDLIFIGGEGEDKGSFIYVDDVFLKELV